MKLTKEDLRVGKMAALEDLLSTCESDIGEFQRDDLTAEQNAAMHQSLFMLSIELAERLEHLRTGGAS